MEAWEFARQTSEAKDFVGKLNFRIHIWENHLASYLGPALITRIIILLYHRRLVVAISGALLDLDHFSPSVTNM
jgi:hypothetical protein